MIAVNLIRPLPHYRRDAFDRGLRRAGYALSHAMKPSGPEDLLVIWNRYGAFEHRADQWELAGGTVLVCENGYIGADEKGHQLYAISAHGHNGSGWWPVGTEDRWSALGVELQPWRSAPHGHYLVCGQRGIGSRSMASPSGWHDRTAATLRAAGVMVKTRLHPGNQLPKTPLVDDLVGATACVIWSSGSGVKALVAGVSVIYAAPHWICEGAARRLSGPESALWMGDREPVLNRMAHAQWTVAEINSGEPFARFRDAIETRRAA